MVRAALWGNKQVMLYMCSILASVGIGVLSTGGLLSAAPILLLAGGALLYWLAKRPQNFIRVLIVLLPLNLFITVVSYQFLHLNGSALTMIPLWKDGLLLAALTYWTVASLSLRNIPGLKNPVMYSAMFFVAWEVIYVVLPLGPLSLTEKVYAFRTDIWFLIFFAVGLLINKSVNVRSILKTILGIALLFSFIAILEKGINAIPVLIWLGVRDYYSEVQGIIYPTPYGMPFTYFAQGGVRRVGSLLLNPLDLAAFMMFALPTVFIIQNNKKRLAAAGLLIIALLFTLSRTAIVLLGLELLALLFWKYPKQRSIIIAGALFSVTTMMFVIPIFFPRLMDYIIQTITFQEASAEGHMVSWQKALTTIAEYPFGMGLGTAGIVGAKYGYFNGGENQYLITAVQLGWVGVLLFVLLLVSIVREVIKFPASMNVEKAWILSVILYLSLSGLAQQSFLNITLTSITFFVLGILIRGRLHAK